MVTLKNSRCSALSALNLIIGGTQPGQIERGALDKCGAVSFGRRWQLLLFQLCQYELINLFFGPAFGEQEVPDFGLRLLCYRLERPPFAADFNIHTFPDWRGMGRFWNFLSRVRRTRSNPFFEGSDLVIGQFACGRHTKFR